MSFPLVTFSTEFINKFSSKSKETIFRCDDHTNMSQFCEVVLSGLFFHTWSQVITHDFASLVLRGPSQNVLVCLFLPRSQFVHNCIMTNPLGGGREVTKIRVRRNDKKKSHRYWEKMPLCWEFNSYINATIFVSKMTEVWETHWLKSVKYLCGFSSDEEIIRNGTV